MNTSPKINYYIAILKGFDESLQTGMILVDLQKAFDTINHKIMLQKREAIGFYTNISVVPVISL